MTLEITAYEALEEGAEKAEATLGLLNQITALADAVKGHARGDFDALFEWGIDREDINSQTWNLWVKVLKISALATSTILSIPRTRTAQCPFPWPRRALKASPIKNTISPCALTAQA